MLLLPTLNRSLSATSNNQAPMLESQRQEMSQTIYVHEITGNLLKVSVVHGLKELHRTGLVAANGVTHSIQYNTITGLLLSGKA